MHTFLKISLPLGGKVALPVLPHPPPPITKSWLRQCWHEVCLVSNTSFAWYMHISFKMCFYWPGLFEPREVHIIQQAAQAESQKSQIGCVYSLLYLARDIHVTCIFRTCFKVIPEDD